MAAPFHLRHTAETRLGILRSRSPLSSNDAQKKIANSVSSGREFIETNALRNVRIARGMAMICRFKRYSWYFERLDWIRLAETNLLVELGNCLITAKG